MSWRICSINFIMRVARFGNDKNFFVGIRKFFGEKDRGYIIWKIESDMKIEIIKNIETYSFICKVFKWNEASLSSSRIVKIIHDGIIHDRRQIDRPHYHKRKISFEEMKRVQKLYYLKILRSYSWTNNPL